jgi:hypothetical protein
VKGAILGFLGVIASNLVWHTIIPENQTNSLVRVLVLSKGKSTAPAKVNSKQLAPNAATQRFVLVVTKGCVGAHHARQPPIAQHPVVGFVTP